MKRLILFFVIAFFSLGCQMKSNDVFPKELCLNSSVSPEMPDSLMKQRFFAEFQRLNSVSEEELSDSIAIFYNSESVPDNPILLASILVYCYRDDLTEDISEGVDDFLFRWMYSDVNASVFIKNYLSVLPSEVSYKIKRRMLFKIFCGQELEFSDNPDFENKDSLRVYYNRLIKHSPNCKQLLPASLLNNLLR
jgi:hypothetical protein